MRKRGRVLPAEPLRVPMPAPRKRWPAIESHWRVVYRNGRLSEPMSRGEARAIGRMFLSSGGQVAFAIVKVMPK